MNKLSGLLGMATTRDCLRGHGRMDLMMGDWALPQVQRIGQSLRQTGVSFVVKLWRCPVCGAVELVDDEVKNGSA